MDITISASDLKSIIHEYFAQKGQQVDSMCFVLNEDDVEYHGDAKVFFKEMKIKLREKQS